MTFNPPIVYVCLPCCKQLNLHGFIKRGERTCPKCGGETETTMMVTPDEWEVVLILEDSNG